MDVAASEFYKDGKYDLDFKNPNSDPSKWLTGEQLADVYRGFIADFPGIYLLIYSYYLVYIYTKKKNKTLNVQLKIL